MDKNTLIRSAGVVGLFTLGSRVLGLTRDVLMAGVFGTSLPMSAFVVAFTVPNLFRRLFGEGALSAAFIPVFVETRKKDGDAASWDLAAKVAFLLAAMLVAITAAGMLAAQWGLLGAEPGSRAAMILGLLRIMMPYMVFICLAALSMAILNSFHHFAVPAATQMLLNVVWIFAVLVIVPRVGSTLDEKIFVVAWAVLVAGLLQLGFQIPILYRLGFRLGLDSPFGDARVGKVLMLMGPAALGMAVTQINVVIDKLLAVWVGPYAPAALFFSERLVYFPLGIFATALGTVLLPALSGHAAAGEDRKIAGAINHGLRNLLFIMTPASVGLLVLAGPIVQTIFEWRTFDAVSTTQTRLALQFYAPGLVMFSLSKVFVPAFYARQDTRTPVKVGLWSVGLNLVLNILFVLTWPGPVKHAGLAFATVLAAAFNAAVLAVILHRRYGSPEWGSIARSGLRSLAAAAAMGCVAVVVQSLLLRLLSPDGGAGKTAQAGSLMGAVAAGMLAYTLVSAMLKAPEIKEILGSLRRETDA